MKNLRLLTVLLASLLIFTGQLISQNTIVGNYYYHDNLSVPVPNIELRLIDSNDSLVATDITDFTGHFSLTNIPYGTFTLEASTAMAAGGVDLYDANLILLYLIGWQDLNDIQLVVADVDASGDVTWTDFGLVFIYYLIYGQPFPAGDWTFEDKTYDFASRAPIIDSTRLWSSTTGDVEGEWEPSGRNINLLPTDYYTMETIDKTETTKFAIAANYDGDLNGFNLNLAYPIDKLNIVSVSGPDENFNYSVDNESGIIKANWLNEGHTSTVSGTQLFNIEVSGINGEQIADGELISLLPGGMLIDSENDKLNDIEIKLPLLKNKQSMEVEVKTYPNPVINNVNFKLQSSGEYSQAGIVVYNLNGQRVAEYNDIEVHEGEQVISLDTKSLIPGNYVFSLTLSGNGEKNIMGRFVKSK